MAYTDKYREQHAELAALALEVKRLAIGARTDEACARVRSELSRLAGKLMVHLSMEDKALYPRLVSHQDAALRETADSFAREMGGIAKAFEAFSTKWIGPAIKADPAGFAAETDKIVEVLKTRIQRENTVLYPLIDRLLA